MKGERRCEAMASRFMVTDGRSTVRFLTALCSVWIASYPVMLFSQDAVVRRVEVVGVGPTRWDARSDAVRKALEQTVTQMVVADRTISADSISRDQVLSTLNGFVHRFEVLSEERVDNEYRMSSAVWVSESRIAPYLNASSPHKAGEVRGDEILGRVNAAREATSRGTLIVGRLFEGFPDQTISIEVKEARPDGEMVQVHVTGRFAEGFVPFVLAGMRSLERRCNGSAATEIVFLTFQQDRRGRYRREEACVGSLGEVFSSSRVCNNYSRCGKYLSISQGVFAGKDTEGQLKNSILAVAYTEQRAAVVELTRVDGQPWWRADDGQSQVVISLDPRPAAAVTMLPAEFFDGARSVSVAIAPPGTQAACGQGDWYFLNPRDQSGCLDAVRRATGLPWMAEQLQGRRTGYYVR